jgi:hypothetical protein
VPDPAKELEFSIATPLARFFEDFYYYPERMPLHGGTMKKGLPLQQMPSVASEIGNRVKRLTSIFQGARRNDPTQKNSIRLEWKSTSGTLCPRTGLKSQVVRSLRPRRTPSIYSV